MNYEKLVNIKLDADECAEMLQNAGDEELAMVLWILADYYGNNPNTAVYQMIRIKNEINELFPYKKRMIFNFLNRLTAILKE